MKYQEYRLGYQQQGNVVEVALSGSAANVRLLDSSNLQNFKSGRKHRYYGGLFKKSHTQLTIPHTGTWYITVDLQGLRGQVRSSVRVIPKESLAPLPEYSPPTIYDLVRPVEPDNPNVVGASKTMPSIDYDVFISHATEDKDDIVRPLAENLVSQGLEIWYDEFELRIGDNLRQKIDFGLA